MISVHIQPPVAISQDKDEVGCDRYTSKAKADLRAKAIGGVVIKERGADIYWVFKTVPTRTVGFIEEG